MDDSRDLLVEIGTEELPPVALQHLSEAFEKGFRDQLTEHRLAFTGIESFATPRRLGLLIRDLEARQPDQEVVRKGPVMQAAYDAQGVPTKAALGFARSCGVSVSELQKEDTPKGTWLVFRQLRQGRSTKKLVLDMTSNALEALPIAKRMRWGERDEEFVRPVHWLVLVFGRESIEGRLFGIDAGRSTHGHRFHAPGAILISSASEYADLLRGRGMVEPSFTARRNIIRRQVQQLANEVNGKPLIENSLLDEVTALCEWPCAIIGEFDKGFLEVPSEVLIETMQKHQKYFPVVASKGELLPKFVAISNIQSRDPSQVKAGNERVIRPRFSDAAFFWQQDLKQPLQDFSPKLERTLFQEKLGTLAEKSVRVSQISRHVAGLLEKDAELAARAAFLAKCDLLTQMILEFPSLQGTMGRYYAEKAGEHPCVVSAMDQQYLPRHAGDVLPQSDCGLILSVADRIDTLVGIFAIGQRPTGVKDPYALRRAAIGLIRILIETPLTLDLKEVLEFSAEELRDKVDARAAAEEVFDYCMERLKSYYQDLHIGGDVVESVLAVDPRVPSDAHRRIVAVEGFRVLPEADALAAANKRIRNILRKSTETPPEMVDASVLREDAEIRLEERIRALKSSMSPLLEVQDYRNILKLLSGIRGDVDNFFDKVMVNAEELELRRNRLALLQSVESLFLKVADISLLQS